MYNIGLFEKLIGSLLHKASLSVCATLTLISFMGELATDLTQTTKSPTFEVGFDHFSPAFAAMEDEYLFSESQDTLKLSSGTSDKLFKQQTTKPKLNKLKSSATIKKNQLVANQAGYSLNFDGSIDFRKISEQNLKKMFASKRPKDTAPSVKAISGEELRFGSLAEMVRPSNTLKPTYQQAINNTGNQQANPQSSENTQKNSDFNQNALEDNLKQQAFDSYNVKGGVRLKDGLAFIGSMEISWVVGDYERVKGSINVPDASFEIPVTDLIGDVIISLYDNKDELIGEGVLDLTQFSYDNPNIYQNIEVRPIDWNHAGVAVHVESIGYSYLPEKTVTGVDIELYAFNEATQTDSSGKFGFLNWKKTNSRTLAIASKPGFKDSLFLLDSKTPAKVIMFNNDYIDRFINYLGDLGLWGIKDRGIIYGSLVGSNKLSGYSVTLKGHNPVYFMNTGIATLDQNQTSDNGLFSFVDLDDGEYELSVEKDGEIIDSKIVIVEQGKVSPVLLNLKSIKKHIEFYDPMNPSREISNINFSFFDGVTSQELENNLLTTQVKGGSDPVLFDYAGDLEVSRSFLSRQKNVQRLPLLNDNRLLKLAEKNNLSINSGLVFGFVEADTPYRVALVESPANKILYFNNMGEPINPQQEVAYGFIMGGFPKGLSSLVIESFDDSMVLATDLIFSDHEAISIVQGHILEAN